MAERGVVPSHDYPDHPHARHVLLLRPDHPGGLPGRQAEEESHAELREVKKVGRTDRQQTRKNSQSTFDNSLYGPDISLSSPHFLWRR